MDAETKAKRDLLRDEMKHARKNFEMAFYGLEETVVQGDPTLVRLHKQAVVQAATLCFQLTGKLVGTVGNVHDRRRWAWWYNIVQMLGGDALSATLEVTP
jgi:hypothetical protein